MMYLPPMSRAYGTAVLLLMAVTPPMAAAQDLSALADEVETELREGLLRTWYPRVLDEEHGGYLSTFDYQWQPQGDQDKFIVTQARHLWMTSKAADFYPGERDRYLAMAASGVAQLRDVMWDREYGGFFDLVTRDGQVKKESDGRIVKRAYGQSFAIYGLAAYYAASKDTAALRLAQEAFHWLEEHSHDPVHGGYFQFLDRDGTPFPDGYAGTPPKDQNSSIHLLEAFTELYHVWPDPLLRERLNEMLILVRDTMTHEKGYLRLFFQQDWTPVSYRDSSEVVRQANYRTDHVSFGHDIETAYLMLEASEALGLELDTTTLRIAKKMVDHSLDHGWDMARGGLYDEGYYFPGSDAVSIIKDTKTWWAQAEALNSLLLMAELFPGEAWRYYGHFLQLWNYTKTYLIDAEYGGWYGGGLDKQPEFRTGLKAHIWKAAYHDGRTLMNLTRRLRTAVSERRQFFQPAGTTHYTTRISSFRPPGGRYT